MKFLKKNPQELTAGESLVYCILVMLACTLLVPIYFGAIALVDEDNWDAVKQWFKNRWLDVKALWSVMFDR